MRSFVTIVLVAALAAFAAAEVAKDGDVFILTDDTFDAFINDKPTVLVKFYAPWCGHCKHLAPEFSAAATAMKDDDPSIILAQVDATAEKKLAERFGISGYPTLFVFHMGAKTEYSGPREKDGIIRYMRAQAGPAVRQCEGDKEKLSKFLASAADIHYVLYSNSKDSKAAKEFSKAADKFRESFQCAQANVAEGEKERIVAYRNFPKEPSEVVFDGKLENTVIGKWMLDASVPLAGVLDANTKPRYGALPMLIVFSTVDAEHDPSGVRYIINRERLAAQQFAGMIHFVAADKSNENFGEFNFDDKQKYNVGIVTPDGKRYKSDIHEVKKDSLIQFVTDYLAGKVEVWVKSQDIPTEQKDGDVRVIVGKTFNEEVLDNKEKDVFIVAYAPWCGHCKALLPTWEKLAKKFNVAGSGVTIAKVDATANTLPSGYEVQGFPSIFFAKAGAGSKPLKYEGGRELDDLVGYVKRMATKALPKEEL